MEFKFKVNLENLYIAVAMFLVGCIFYAIVDSVSTPTVEETASWKAKEELKMETEAKMAEILLQARCTNND
jgi:hypothetical protein